jgi:uncharacterized protein (DUF1697 family)
VTGTYVALLRGINVGGRNKLPMRELATIFADAGCTEVATYIQSGNVVFRAADELAARVSDLITNSIAERFGLRVPVVTRSAKERAHHNLPALVLHSSLGHCGAGVPPARGR